VNETIIVRRHWWCLPEALAAKYPDKIVVQSGVARSVMATGFAIAAAAKRDAITIDNMAAGANMR
jgi:hypothetical protein